MARHERQTVGPITERRAAFTAEDAYEVQHEGIELRKADGEAIIGGKLGFTSKAMQRAMGVPSPNYGWITDAMMRSGDIDLDELIHPKVEPEILFTLSDDLDDPDATAADVRSATGSVAACLEVVDSRYHDFVFKPHDNIADNSSAAQLVVGDGADVDDANLALVGVVVMVEGEVRHTAAGAAALDDPAEAVAWMARAVAGTDRPLLAGDIVISGGLTSPIDLQAGQKISVEIDRIGTCSLNVRK